MDKQPLVSIIIPTYNRADLISETLDSIIAQTYQNWECIVVDDGSTDNTAEILKDYTLKDNRISYHHRPKKYKPGGNGARNYGFDISKGEYINWFDSDDVMYNFFIDISIKTILENDVHLCVIQSQMFSNTNNFGDMVVKGDLNDDLIIEKFFRKEIVWTTQNPVISKSFQQNNKIKFSEELKAAQDWEYFMRILVAKPSIIFINKVGIKIRLHEKSISHNKSKYILKLFHYYKARNLVFNNVLNKKSKNDVESYYKNYVNNFLKEFLKYNNYTYARYVIHKESKGTRKYKNYIFSLLFFISGKGLSYIKI